MFIDTHCHLDIMVRWKKNKGAGPCCREIELSEIELIVKESSDAGVTQLLTIGTSAQNSIEVVDIASRFDGVWAVVGIHPCDCSEAWARDLDNIKKLVKNKKESKKENKIVGIGETGLDFYHKPFFKQRQIDAFKGHIECAIENDLPIVLHVRESAQEALKVLEEYKGQVRGVAHCFFQKRDIADVLIDFGFYLGISAPISYPKNEWLRDIIKDIDLKHFLLETDAPFLPPQEFRGKKNHPKYIPLVAQIVADVKGISRDEVGRVTSKNASDLFVLPHKKCD